MAGSSAAAMLFQWGNRQAGTLLSYESMRFRGVWYNLHDCVACKSGEDEPYVGKLMRLFEDEDGIQKVRIRWFFRAAELPRSVVRHLAEGIKLTKEVFIGMGGVAGVENENEVGVIRGKLTVLCTARFGMNVVPSEAQVEAADYFFTRAFDVESRKVVELSRIRNKYLAQNLENKAKWLEVEEGADDDEEDANVEDDADVKELLVSRSERSASSTSKISSMEIEKINLKRIRGMSSSEKEAKSIEVEGKSARIDVGKFKRLKKLGP